MSWNLGEGCLGSGASGGGSLALGGKAAGVGGVLELQHGTGWGFGYTSW